MSDDASPANLRKFLESDDPALVRMGIALAKGAGVEVTVKDLVHLLKSEDVETIKTGVMLADEADIGDEAMKMLCEPLGDGNEEVCQATAEALGEIGDARAVEPLIKALNVIDKIEFYRQYRQWEPGIWSGLLTAVVEALEKLGDVRAVGPLARALESENLWMDSGNDILYHGFFTIPIVEAMIGIGIDTITENERSLAGAHLKLMLEIGSEEEPITLPGDHFYDWRIAELICEVGPAYCSRWRIASCSGFIRMALWETPDETFCELLIQNLENRTQPLIRIIEESRGIYSRAAAEALDRQGWQPDTDELRANYLIATEQWDQCSNLGASAVEPLVRALESELAELRSRRSAGEDGEDEIALEPIVKVFGDIGDVRAVEPLIEALEMDDIQFGVQQAAAEALGKIGDSRAVEPLIEMLSDDDRRVRESVASALGKIADVRALEPLIKLLGEGNSAAMEVLGEIGDKRAVEPLVKALGGGNSNAVDLNVLGVLEKLGWKPETDELRVSLLLAKGDLDGCSKLGERAVDSLIKALEGPYNENAAEALGKIGDVRAVEPLIKALSLNEPKQFSEGSGNEKAAWALGVVGDVRAVEPLIKALGHDDYWVRGAAMDALVVLDWKPETETHRIIYQLANYFPGDRLSRGSDDTKVFLDWGDSEMELLIKLLGGGNSNAAWALGKIGNPRAVDALIKALKADSPQISSLAAEALGAIGDERAIEPLINGLAMVCGEAAMLALVEIGEPTVESLIKALGDDDDYIRNAAVWALGEIGDARAVEALIKALRNEDENESFRYSALGALEKVGEPAMAPLIRVLGDEGLRYHAMEVLKKIGEPMVQPFISALGDMDHNVRRIAAEELGKKGNTQAVEPLIKLLRDEDKDVHEASTKALIEIGEPAIQPLVKALDDEDIRNSAVRILDRLGWKSDDYGVYVSMLVSSGLKLSPKKQKEIEGVCAKLLPKEKIMNLEQKEFAEIVKLQSKSLETMDKTAKDIIGLLSGSSAQARWIVACGVVEISCYDGATIDKIFENPINIFWSEMLTYPNLITKTDRDEIRTVLKRLPPVLISQIGQGLYIFATARSNKDTSDTTKRNRKMVTTFFEDPGLAKIAWRLWTGRVYGAE